MVLKNSDEHSKNSLSTAQGPGISTAFWVILSFVVAAYMIFMHLGLLPLMNPDEGRNASIAWEVQNSGRWLIPTYNGLPYLDKPILFFKTVAMSLSLFGHNEFAARLPSALSALGILIMVFLFCRREYSLRTAAFSVFVISTAPLFFGFSRCVIFDMLLAFFVCASIFAGYFAEKAEGNIRQRWYIVYAAMSGIATLVKGPVGFILPILVLTVFNYLDGRREAVRRLLSWKNFLIMSAVIMPWFIGVSILHPDFPYYGLVKETFLRFTTNTFHRSGPFYYYLPVIFGTFIFWSLLLPEMAIVFWRQRRKMLSADRLLSVWTVSVILFFSLSHSKLPGYILTAIIALGILTARIFDTAMGPAGKAEANVVRHGSLFLSIISIVLAAALIVVHMRPPFVDTWFRRIRNPAVLQSIRILTLPLFLLFIGMAVLAIRGIIHRNIKTMFFAFLMLPAAVPSLVLPAAAPTQFYRSGRGLAEKIIQGADGAEVACLRCFPEGIIFYLKRPVTVFTADYGSEIKSNYIPFYLSKKSIWPQHIRRVEDFKSWIAHRRKPVFLIVRSGRRPRLNAIAENYHKPMQYLGQNYWGVLLTPKGER